MMGKKRILELFAVIILVIIFTSLFFFRLYDIKSHIRNNVRQGNAADIKRALMLYREEEGNFPVSREGECLRENGDVYGKLEDMNIIEKISPDPLWPKDPPHALNEKGLPVDKAQNFCYWYLSPKGKEYYLSYYLEPSIEKGEEGVVVESFQP